LSPSTDQDFRFEQESHTYWIGKKEVPSVTTVLEPMQQLDGIPLDVLEAARKRGHLVHHACALMLQKNLEWSQVPADIVGYLEAARKFIKESSVRVIAVERQMFDPDLKVAGTVDFLGILGRDTGVFD
jgi:UDP-glucose 4-epimerase